MILITGGSGYLGKELIKLFPDSLHPAHKELDITDDENVKEVIKKSKPSIIIHLAGLTGIRECENDKKLAWESNYLGTLNLIKACEQFNNECYFVYMSATGVFYGDRGSYSEDDLPYPINYYGLTKFLGEVALQSSNLKKWLIIRANCVHLGRWHYPKAFVDRYGTYLFTNDTAKAIKDVITQGLTGIVHIAGEEKMSLYEVVKITTPDVQPITLKEYDGPPAPVDMSLVSKRIKPYKITKNVQTVTTD